MTTAAGKKTANYGSWAFATSAVGLVLLVAAIPPTSYPKVQIDKCPFDSAGRVIPDRTADGLLTLAAGIYFVHRDGVDDSIVAAYRGRWAGSSPLRKVEGHVGEAVHVEYCGRTVTDVTASGVTIFEVRPDTQATINSQADSERRSSVIMGAGWLLLGVLFFFKWRLLKREADYTIG
ncbi:hypothetical protein P0D69_18135 [Paraburkholderia sediminicola]|uniref:hypothetical protein n=1 Tax=Paraburkholderia sediminicola TaxID=458836 RepID=UPI0038B8F020